MKKGLMIFVALFLALAVALPAFAVELKYGGLFRARLQSNDNFIDGTDDFDDHQNYIDQRLRIFFIFQSSENLKLVTGFEQDTLWGDSRAKVLDGHRDTVGLELKHAYLDFNIPNTPVNAKVGLQPIAYMQGWIVDEDFTAALTTMKFDPVQIKVGYIGERNNNVQTEDENIDDWVLSVDYANGPFKAGAVFFYQYGHDNGNNFSTFANIVQNATSPFGEDDNLFDLGLYFEYKDPMWSAYINFVKNFGSVDDATGESFDYTGWMVEAGGAYYCGPFTFTLGGFVTSGQDLEDDDDEISTFVYPVGRSHYWSEIMGFGTLETTFNDAGAAGAGDPPPATRGNYSAGDHPSNLWTITAGASWQILDGTKATLNYYYIGTTEDTISGVNNQGFLEFDSSIGHELDFYLDQAIVDKLSVRFVAAYLFAEDGLTVLNEDDDLYEVGARLQWAF